VFLPVLAGALSMSGILRISPPSLHLAVSPTVPRRMSSRCAAAWPTREALPARFPAPPPELSGSARQPRHLPAKMHLADCNFIGASCYQSRDAPKGEGAQKLGLSRRRSSWVPRRCSRSSGFCAQRRFGRCFSLLRLKSDLRADKAPPKSYHWGS